MKTQNTQNDGQRWYQLKSQAFKVYEAVKTAYDQAELTPDQLEKIRTEIKGLEAQIAEHGEKAPSVHVRIQELRGGALQEQGTVVQSAAKHRRWLEDARELTGDPVNRRTRQSFRVEVYSDAELKNQVAFYTIAGGRTAGWYTIGENRIHLPR